MRLLVLNYEFPPVGGGGGYAAADFCRHLARLGHEIRVVTSHVKGLPPQEVRDGYEIYRIRSGRRRAHTCTVPEMAGYLAGAFIPALKQALAWRPHVLHAHFAVPTGLLAWVIHRLTGIPYVVTAYLGDVPGGVPAQTDRLFRWLKPFTVPTWRHAASITVPCEYVAELARRSYGVEVNIVPNGVELDSLHPLTSTVPSPVRLVFSGRFSLQKNLMFLLEVLEKLRELDWRLDLVGDGPLRQTLEVQAQRGGLAERVEFHGWVAPEAAIAIMRRSDILIMPSLAESLPLAGLQALGLGLALVGSDHGGFKDLVQEGVNGFTCPVTDADTFAHRLRPLLADPQLLVAMKQASLKLAPRFEVGRIARQMERLLLAAGGRGN